MMAKILLNNRTVIKKYRILRKLNYGCECDVYSVLDMEMGKMRTLKIKEKKKTVDDEDACDLEFEYSILNMLDGAKGLPKIHAFESLPNFNLLIMDALGPTLETTFRRAGIKGLNMKTATLLAINMINNLESIHSKGVVYGDLNATNVVLSKVYKRIYFIDFSRAAFYCHLVDGTHDIYEENTECFNKSIFSSINAHLGNKISRRDDMISLGHLLLYLLNLLPWAVLQYEYDSTNLLNAKCTAKLSKIGEHNLPRQLCHYFRHCYKLEFEAEPNYNYLRKLLLTIIEKSNSNILYKKLVNKYVPKYFRGDDENIIDEDNHEECKSTKNEINSCNEKIIDMDDEKPCTSKQSILSMKKRL